MTTKRCTWVSMDNPLMLQYHDREWGVPVHDDREPNPEAHIGSGDHSKPDENRSRDTPAQGFLAIQEELGSFDAYCWRFVDGRPKLNRWKAVREIPPTSSESDAFSKDLKHRGFSFVGSTVVYAHMQAVGMVNDHLVDCFRYREIRQDWKTI